MNRYTLGADGRRWWWASALAGTAALASIVALSTAGHALPAPTTRDEPAPTYDVTGTTPRGTITLDRYCFLYRAHWNDALDGPRPVCGRYAVRVADPTRGNPDFRRPGLDFGP